MSKKWGEPGYVPVMPDDFIDYPCLDGPLEGEMAMTYPPEMEDGTGITKMYPFEGARFESIQGHKIRLAIYKWSQSEQGYRYSHDDYYEGKKMGHLTFHDDKAPDYEDILAAGE